MDTVEYRHSATSTIRSEISSTASSGFAFVSAPIKKQRGPIPEYEPPPDYSPYNSRRHKHDNEDGPDLKQALLSQQSTHTNQSSSEEYRIDDDRKKLRIETDNHSLTVEIYEPQSPNSTSLSPRSDIQLLPRTQDSVQGNRQTTAPCTCSKKLLCILVTILGTALVMTVIFVVLLFTVCISGRTPACS